MGGKIKRNGEGGHGMEGGGGTLWVREGGGRIAVAKGRRETVGE